VSPSSSTSSSSSSVSSPALSHGAPTSPATSPNSNRSLYTPPPPPPHLRSLKKPLYRPAVLRYGTSLKVNGQDWSYQLFWGQIPPVSGPPRRNHWVADESVEVCSYCKKPFTFWDRRHHCRRCGQIFCGGHSSHLLRLDQNCNFHPSGALSRTCDTCANDFNKTVVDALNSTHPGAESAVSNINRINDMIRNSGPGARDLPVDITHQDISSDDETATLDNGTHSGMSTPVSTISFNSFLNGYGTASPEPAASETSTLSSGLSRQLQIHAQQQLGALPTREDGRSFQNDNIPVGTPSDQVVGSVPADWSWSTF
ncbi:hypothetical protein V1511DRAFT_452213, partial [Dipodascopsis uninucleata]